MQQDLFSTKAPAVERLGPQAVLLRAFAGSDVDQLLSAIDHLERRSPFRQMVTPGGFRMSVAMTSCGDYGWVTDRSGYRYSATDPQTISPWPAMPDVFKALAQAAAAQGGFPDFEPDACLINRYSPGAKLSLHQDKDEKDLSQPVVSVSLGVPAVFQFGGLKRGDKKEKVTLRHGDVVVWGGEDRLRYHGILPLKLDSHPLLGDCRLNLTFRKAF